MIGGIHEPTQGQAEDSIRRGGARTLGAGCRATSIQEHRKLRTGHDRFRRRGKAPEIRKYRLERVYSYEEYDRALAEVDAVYLVLPNHLHREYAVRAAEAGIHVLCEKPMAVTEEDCEAMIDAANTNHVKLMIAYRLHFEEANQIGRAHV